MNFQRRVPRVCDNDGNLIKLEKKWFAGYLSNVQVRVVLLPITPSTPILITTYSVHWLLMRYEDLRL
jgi:hypothetical protein